MQNKSEPKKRLIIIEDDDETSIVSSPHNLLIGLISNQKAKEEKQDIWKDSPYKDLVKLQSNNAGIVGEQYIHNICETVGITCEIDGTKTKKIGGGKGDGVVNGKSVEIKTAHQGSCLNNFQHELGEMPWNADYMIFIDIAPFCIYLTIFTNFTEEHYKSGDKCAPCFPSRQVTWRKGKGAFKLDSSVNINESNVANGNSIKITETTDINEIADYIKSKIQ